MAETPQRLSERLIKEGGKTRLFFQAIRPEQWAIEVYTDGSCWTVYKILAHFVASEASLDRLVENIASGGPGVPEDFDLNAYNERKVAQIGDPPPEQLLAEFSLRRQDLAGHVAQLSQADLTLSGRHPYLGVASVEEIIKLIYIHNQIHQREIRKQLEEFGG